MDHMMPGMDGIEATQKIRDGGFTNPIIALSANAIAGMQEFFIKGGMDDFISKPIEEKSLNAVLVKWLPKEKISKEIPQGNLFEAAEDISAHSLNIEGVDVRRGISMTGGSASGYRKVLALFYKDAFTRLPFFAREPAAENLVLFATNAHALKSASATIGAEDFSRKAAELEAAGKAGDKQTIAQNLSAFYTDLKALAENIQPALELQDESGRISEQPSAEAVQAASPEMQNILAQLQAALKAKSMKEIDAHIAKIEKLPLTAKNTDIVNSISDSVLMGEYTTAIELLTQLQQM
jgi:CheY-like chemotaxis protein